MSKTSGSIDVTSTIAPLIVWLIAQIIALTIPAIGIPTSARPSQNPEFAAFSVMLVTQVCVGTLLFPGLFRQWHAAVAVHLTALPMISLATMLSATPTHRIFLPAILTIAWLASLAMLRSAMPSRGLQHFAVAIASTGVCVPLILLSLDQPAAPSVSPAASALLLLNGKPFSIWDFGPVLIVFLTAIACRVGGKPSSST